MWYTNKITVQQNPNFYTQKGISSHISNKIDKTEYQFFGGLGAWFKSYEKKEPKIGTKRWIYETEFKPSYVYERGKWIFKSYEICWVPTNLVNNSETMDRFYKDNISRR